MPIVQIDMLEGRTVEQKREMVKSVTKAISTSLSVPEDAVTIIIKEMAHFHFAEGGKLKSDAVAAAKTTTH